MVISPETGTLLEAEVDDDHTEEATYVQAGVSVTATDTVRSATYSPA